LSDDVAFSVASSNMWLLHTSSGEIEYFIADDSVPPYAILSHTWGDEEVSVQDWKSEARSKVRLKKGFAKIELSMAQARKDGLEWIWIDT
jgi:hypothetical protein